MKRWIPVGIGLAVLLSAFIWLNRPVLQPEQFTGRWYAQNTGIRYTFEEGLIWPEGTDTFGGAYCFGKDSVFLFAPGVEGLEKEQQLYLVSDKAGDLLCEKEDGTGTVYFRRSLPVDE